MHHPNNTDVLINIPPRSKQNPDYGFSIGQGSFKFQTNTDDEDDDKIGSWMTIVERVKLNDIGVSNGELELFINGKSTILAKGLILRNSLESFIHGLHFQTFFGGHTEEWASTKDQYVWFSDISGAIIE